MNVDTGDLLDGRFRIECPAGAGGMGLVFRAVDLQRDRPVAVKVLRDARIEPLRLAREIAVLSQLRHPGIVGYVADGIVDGAPFLVMEWVEGETLARRLAREGLTAAEAVSVVRSIADALAAAHRLGMIHRDVKPGNVIFADGRVDRPMVIDFGLARREREPLGLTRTGMLLGTPGYMPPEQARGERADARSDVFSLGCLLYECLTGMAPFQGSNAMAIRCKVLFADPAPVQTRCPDVPPALAELVGRMMAKDAARRPADAREVAAALAAEPPIASTERRRSGLVEAASCEATLVEPRRFFVVATPLVDDVELAPALVGDRLVDGSLIVTIDGDGAPGALATAAVERALALRGELPHHVIAVIADDAVSAASAIDRGIELLQRASVEAGAGVVVVDAATARLVAGGFAIRVAGGLVHVEATG